MKILEQLKDELDLLQTLEFKEVSNDQKQILREKYNFYGGKIKYTEDDWGNVIFVCSEDTFKSMEYYLGLEYERESIEYKIHFNEKIIVSYSGSYRVENLLIELEKLESK